jgi:hypothetical protein
VKELPEDIRLQTLCTLFFRSASNFSIEHPSAPHQRHERTVRLVAGPCCPLLVCKDHLSRRLGSTDPVL